MNVLQIKNRFKLRSSLMIVGAFILLLATGCRKDSVNTDPGEPNFPNPTATIESRFEGLINTQNGEPLEGAIIKLSGEQTMTDEDGFFRFEAVKMYQSGSHVVISKEGYIDGHKIIYPHVTSSTFMEVMMVKKEDPKRFPSSNGGDVATDGNGSIVFLSDAIRLESGGDYSGEVSVYTHWYSPSDPQTALTMPGNLEAMDESSRVQLETYGMMYVELRGENNQKLQLKEGNPAQVTFPALESLEGARDILPLWSFDETNGMWVKEGTATLVGDHYEGEVKHFSFWNCDYPWSSVLVEGRLINNSGAAISNYPVRIYRNNNNRLVGFGYTNSDGEFEGRVPADVELRFNVRHCGVELINEVFGPLDVNTDLGDFQTDLTDFAFGVSGNVVNCSGGPATDAYGIANRKLVTVNLDGTFSTIMTGCGNQSAFLTLIDPVNLSTKTFDLPTGQGDQGLGEISLCDLSGAYIVYTVDGDDPILASAPEAYFVDGEIEITNTGSQLDNVYFTGLVSSFAAGEQPLISMYTSFNKNSTYIDFWCREETASGQPGHSCSNLMWTNDVTGDVGDTLKGTFIGTAFSGGDTINGGNPGTVVQVHGSFSIPIIKNYQSATINGSIWLDTNPNNVRDPDEEDFIRTSINLKKANGDFVSGKYGLIDDDGNFVVHGIEPGEYYMSAYIPAEYDLVVKDAGADDVDSEFYLDVNGQARTDLFTIGDGETLEDMDLGFTVPEFRANGARITGCIPEISIFFKTVGGVRPFTFDLSDGQTNDHGTFIVATSELYSCTVTDALGRSVETFLVPETHNNQIRGIVWEEDAGGQDDVYDANIDQKYGGAFVNLLDENGTFISNTVSSWNGYGFVNLKPGKYIIEIEVPAGYELVTEGVGMDETIDSDINTSTMRSEIIEIVDCFEFTDIYIGLKKQ